MYYIYGLLPCSRPGAAAETTTSGSTPLPQSAASTSGSSTVNTVNLTVVEGSTVRYNQMNQEFEVVPPPPLLNFEPAQHPTGEPQKKSQTPAVPGSPFIFEPPAPSTTQAPKQEKANNKEIEKNLEKNIEKNFDNHQLTTLNQKLDETRTEMKTYMELQLQAIHAVRTEMAEIKEKMELMASFQREAATRQDVQELQQAVLQLRDYVGGLGQALQAMSA